MTLNTSTTKVTYNGDGATTVFAVSFVFWNNGDLRVIHRDANGGETVWTEGTHYTLTGGAGTTGALTVSTAPTDHTPAAGETLTIKDSQPETQGDSLPLSGAFPSTVVEQRLDKLTRLIQNHSEEIARSILLPETSGVSGLQIPEPGAGELVRYNPAGTSLETVKAADLSLGVDALLTGLATNDFLRWDNGQGAWVNVAAGATGLAVLQDVTAADARADLALGTAAVANTGVASGNVPAMDATGYPAADGSRITNLEPDNVTAGIAPRGFIDGLTLSNNGTNPAKDIDVAAGVARDGGDAANMVLSSTLTKRLDASWAAGTNQGGLDGTESVTGTPDANTWYHVWLIRRSDTGAVDALFSESAEAPAMPPSYDQKRRIGAVLTDGVADIVGFTQFGDEFSWDSRVTDFSGTAGSTAATLLALTVPTGLNVIANFTATIGGTIAGWALLVTSPDQTDVVPTASTATLYVRAGYAGSVTMRIKTNVSGQIRRRSDNAGQELYFVTQGWIDPRGRNV